MNKQYRNFSLAVAVMLLWGSLFPCVKLGYKAFSVTSNSDILLFAGVRFVICGALITLFAFFKNRKDLRFSRRELLLTVLMGAFAIILHYTFTYIGLSMTDSSKTALLKQAGALLYIAFSAFFFKDDKLTLQKLLGTVIGFSGIVVLNIGGGGISFGMGEVLILLASVCTVASNVIGKHLYATKAPVAAMGVSQLFGGAVMLIIGFLSGGSMSIAESKAFPIMGYIVFASSLSYCIWSLLVKAGKLSGLFIIKFLEPIFACIFGWILLGEDILKWQYLISFLLVIFGISVSKIKTNK